MVLEINQDQTVICFLAWASARPTTRKSALVNRQVRIVRLFIEGLDDRAIRRMEDWRTGGLECWSNGVRGCWRVGAVRTRESVGRIARHSRRYPDQRIEFFPDRARSLESLREKN